ncbi:HERV-H LTR-associating protein 2 [Merluccius polli]|uniref:HERV-H LTR-associating protein 2 n=1 Tax=Merluccius polli TaxID=89951 RepID=A0AA47MU52_MERPO|nr:HERV-H LTR-associating protein 2 [Merluccius polli]
MTALGSALTQMVVLLMGVVAGQGATQVDCVFGGSCLLPCRLRPDSNTILHWLKRNGKDVQVHSYYADQDQLKHQDPLYRGRTSLFPDQISGGNASLRLARVNLQDQGTYKCYARGDTTYVTLAVRAPLGTVDIMLVNNTVTCKSGGIYPRPELTWSISPRPATALQNTTEVHEDYQGLYDISGSLRTVYTESVYSCSVQNEHSARTATMRQNPPMQSAPKSEVLLPCNASGLADITWTFNHNQPILRKRAGQEKQVETEWQQHVGGLSESGSLLLNTTSAESAGTYTCTVSYAEETDVTNIELKILEDHNEESTTDMFFLRCIKKFGMSTVTLLNFYRSTIESILTGCILVWFGNITAQDYKLLMRTVKTAHHYHSLRTYTTRCKKKALSIMRDPSHPAHYLFERLTISWLRCIGARTSRLRESFYPQVVRLLNTVFLMVDVLVQGAPQVDCVFGGSCLLPCRFQPNSNIVLHWVKKNGTDVNVHSYYEDQDQLGLQDPLYKGRTVDLQDHGRYLCYARGNLDHYVTLTVRAPVGTVDIMLVNDTVTCKSGGIYPRAELTWSISPHPATALQNTTMVHEDDQGLYDISSSLRTVYNDTESVYSCSVQNEHGARTATMRQNPPMQSAPKSEVLLPCNASGLADITWTFNHNQPILRKRAGQEKPQVETEWQQHVGGLSESGSLLLHTTSAESAGTYTCTVRYAEETDVTNIELKILEDHNEAPQVVCVFGGSCLLPCSFQPNSNTILHWVKKNGKDVNVHSYYEDQDQLKYQDPLYKGRTSLFPDQISGGNASLRLARVDLQDQGTYMCYARGNPDKYVTLTVRAPVGTVYIMRVNEIITCKSGGIYPRPELTWSISPHPATALQNTTMVHEDYQGLYDISGSLRTVYTESVYSCSVQNEHGARTATMRQNPPMQSAPKDEVLLPCNASGLADITWTFNHNQPILRKRAGQEKQVETEWQQHVGLSESGSLLLHTTSAESAGTYTCTVSYAEETDVTNIELKILEDHNEGRLDWLKYKGKY